MRIDIDSIIGMTFGKWHVDSFAYTKKYDHYFNCTCECGTKKVVLYNNLRRGLTKSCGCDKGRLIHDRFFIDRTGQTFNDLTCIGYEHRDNGIYWHCVCKCGNETWVEASNLVSGAVKSCGCRTKEPHNVIHGMSHTKIHNMWSRMIYRCSNPNCDSYKWYGGEGKDVREEWKGTDGFIRFYEWAMNNGYEDGLSIERKDVDKGYSPDNCCFIPLSQQTWNTRVSKRITVHGEEYSVPQLSKKYGIPAYKIHSRIDAGWKPEEIVELEPHKRGEKWVNIN